MRLRYQFTGEWTDENGFDPGDDLIWGPIAGDLDAIEAAAELQFREEPGAIVSWVDDTARFTAEILFDEDDMLEHKADEGGQT